MMDGEKPDQAFVDLFRKCLPIFNALGDPARQDIVLLLAHHDRLGAGSIAEQSPLSRPAVSHHLKVLRDAGVISLQRRGTEYIYSLDDHFVVDRLRALLDAIQSCRTSG